MLEWLATCTHCVPIFKYCGTLSWFQIQTFPQSAYMHRFFTLWYGKKVFRLDNRLPVTLPILPHCSYMLPVNMRCTLCVAMSQYKLCNRETKTFIWLTVNWTFFIKRECWELFSGKLFSNLFAFQFICFRLFRYLSSQWSKGLKGIVWIMNFV
jgi:hypothetical protein